MVKQGRGIHDGRRWAFQQRIIKGEVIEVLPCYRQDVLVMNSIWSPDLVLLARVRLFIDFIVHQVKRVDDLV